MGRVAFDTLMIQDRFPVTISFTRSEYGEIHLLC